MNYKESKKILAEIKKARKILLNCHSHPDPDSVSSCLAVYRYLKSIGKEVTAVTPEKILDRLHFLPGCNEIKLTDMMKYKYSKYDLFIILDSSGWDRVLGVKNVRDEDVPVKIPTVVIDHHISNTKYGDINLVDYASSTAEILYKVFTDWRLKIDKAMATILLTGIYSDSGSFQYDYTSSDTLRISADLIELGADKEKVVLCLFKSFDYNHIKFYGELLKRMRIDEESDFVWTAVSFEDFKKYGEPRAAKSMAASLFFGTVKGASFGIVMVEQKRGVLDVSFRSRAGVDVSRLAKKLGGSGHQQASGTWFEKVVFNEAVKKVLKAAREYAKEIGKKKN